MECSSYASSDVDNDNDNNNNNNDSRFKSKNLDAERRRRAKLNDRLLQLRALVPIITNMTKEYIIKDAITYIQELDAQVSELQDVLLQLGNSFPRNKEETKPAVKDAAKEMKNCEIEPEVRMTPIDDNKVWIKVVYEKKIGGFTKLVEAITNLGLEFNDTTFTTSNGSAVISSCLEGMMNDVEETEELIMHVISSI